MVSLLNKKPQPGAARVSRPFIASSSHKKQSLPQFFAKKINSWTAASSSDLPTAPKPSDTICVICISDTHNSKPPIPEGDILLHAGDLSQYGLFDEIQAQLDWLNTLPHKHKVVIGGNHDLILDEEFVKRYPDRELDKPGKSRIDLHWGNIIYLHNSSVTVACHGRALKIYGSPLTPKCGNFGFQYDRDEDIWTDSVPEDTDVLLTHGPPAVYIDEGKGCKHLLKEIWRARPRLVVFEHIHGARGEAKIGFNHTQECYERILLGMQPWFNFFYLIVYTCAQLLYRKASAENSTHLVNAAVVTGRGNDEQMEAIVTHI